MLEKVDVDQKIDKAEYDLLMADMRTRLGEVQRQVKQLKIPVRIVFEGLDGAGKGTLINELIQRLDPRGFKVYSDEMEEARALRPFLWHYWVSAPAAGLIAVYHQSWYHRILRSRGEQEPRKLDLQSVYKDIVSFERQQTDADCVIIKFFLHISRREQKKRFEEIDSNPSMKWRITPDSWKRHKQYDEYIGIVENMLTRTDSESVPWTVVAATDRKYAIYKVCTTVLATLENKIREMSSRNQAKADIEAASVPQIMSGSILDKVDLKKSMEKHEYAEQIKELEKTLHDLHYQIYDRKIPVIILFEGWDAAGKGGNIRRLTKNLDPRGYEVVPIAAPNDVEKSHHYMWRFWRAIPNAGRMTIFDRSWYGRVLVERVEGFCSPSEWRRAYREINEFEEQLTGFGTIIVKFWLHIDKDEQLLRFKERESNPAKQMKITDEDWRNREQWDSYQKAVDEMLLRTSTPYAPWTIVESNSKKYSRVKALQTVAARIQELL